MVRLGVLPSSDCASKESLKADSSTDIIRAAWRSTPGLSCDTGGLSCDTGGVLCNDELDAVGDSEFGCATLLVFLGVVGLVTSLAFLGGLGSTVPFVLLGALLVGCWGERLVLAGLGGGPCLLAELGRGGKGLGGR